ncbi:MAG: ABC transporter ATP-binding protein [Proteobacteria bacterium]|nr:ABC transporter ATP-binding protein [Pseudomonadota bacterium]MBI3505757.1 ABC transporter ATP-binding protein [Pseudomonadota bacterium]
MTELLAVDGLRVRFRATSWLGARLRGIPDPFLDAVLDVSFRLAAGETLGLVGESGSGKTTLARAILGLVDIHAGSIRFRERELVGLGASEHARLRRHIGFMFQDPVASLSPRKTVRSLVLEPSRIHRIALPDPEAEARRLLDMVGLNAHFLDAYPHQLSGGQARRVGVARALALEPALIIADEPTAGLDVSVQGEVLNLMNGLQQRLGLSYLVVTHNLPVVRHISDRLAIMYLGRLVEQGPTSTVFQRPAHPYTKALLEAVPQPEPDRRRTNLELQGEVPSLRQRPSGCEFHTRCLYAQERCRSEAPAFVATGAERGVRCHFPLV